MSQQAQCALSYFRYELRPIGTFCTSKRTELRRGARSAILACCLILSGRLGADPYRPKSDDVVLERLPVSSAGATMSEFRKARFHLQGNLENREQAVSLAKQLLDQGRRASDPRFASYAEGILQPWLSLANPPADVLVLRAIVRQRQHEFSAALKDLDGALRQNPNFAQAWLTRASILQVLGRYEEALDSARPLIRLTDRLVSGTTLLAVAGLNGEAEKSYRLLSQLYRDSANSPDSVKAWTSGVLADLALRLGNSSAADKHFQEALQLDSEDGFLQAAYADFLLDQNRPGEAAAFLRKKVDSDALLLRLALAEKRSGTERWRDHAKALEARFAANRLRGDETHAREEARFRLWLKEEPERALTLAQLNWAVQREPEDARILLEACLAAQAPEAARGALQWIEKARWEDVRLAPLIAQLRNLSDPSGSPIGLR